MTTWKLDLDGDAMKMLQDFQDERDALRQRVAILEADNKNCLNLVHEMLDQLAACQRERDEYKHLREYWRDEANDLKNEVVASQAREQQLREALEPFANSDLASDVVIDDYATKVLRARRTLSIHHDTSALDAAEKVEPEGWQLVPKKPTPEMCEEAAGTPMYVVERYKAMLYAAPTPPTNTESKHRETTAKQLGKKLDDCERERRSDSADF